MDNFGSGSSGEGGYPGRSNNSINRSFNPLSLERGAAAPLPPTFSNANGMLGQNRPSGGTPGGIALSSSESNNINHRTQQPNHEVFMVREASRSNIFSSSSGGTTSSTDRLSFTGAPPTTNTDRDHTSFSGEVSNHITSSTSNNLSSTNTNRHHRSSSERSGEKDNKLVHPKMLKIAVVGEPTSGKTGICNAFTSEGYSFSRNYHMTTGVSIYAKSIRLPGGGGSDGVITESPNNATSSLSHSEDILEHRINLVLVDSAGKPLYRELLPQYWDQQLDGLALVIDLTSTTALETALSWLNLVKECLKLGRPLRQPSDEVGDQSGGNKRGGLESSPTLGVLIGSKNDLKDQRVISPKAAQDFASQHGLQYFECSAKENSGIEEPFFYLAHQWASTNSSHDKDSNEKEGNSTLSGGIFAKNGAPTASRKAAFRQNSSEAF